MVKIIHWWPALCLAAICLVFFTASGQSVGQSDVDLHHSEQVAQPQSQPAERSTRQRFELPKIFDFELYKRLFKRAYHGLEESVRRKFMLARAFRAWISSLKYKYRTSSYYLALNHLSDRSPDELERMENHFAAGHERVEKVIDAPSPTDQIPEVDPNYIEENLEKLASGQGDGSEGFQLLQNELREQQVSRTRRRRRDLEEQSMKPRDLDMNRLFSVPDDQTLEPETARKVQWKPPSNNPNYEAPEMISCGLRDDNIQEMDWFEQNVPAPSRRKHSFFSDNAGQLRGSKMSTSAESRPGQELADEVFFDHRHSKCLFLPRDQGNCGSCYAFAMTAIAEFLNCKQTGKLVALSEQYILDCGLATNLTGGCRGGNEYKVAWFIHNYGVELRVNYPYRGRSDQCPYDQNTDPKSMGYLRMDLGFGVDIPLHLVAGYLPLQPMLVLLNTRNGFREYGGGVMDNPCPAGDYGHHSVVLIGHGREDGREYWLMRNSYSTGWGERGHYKQAKDNNCIQPAFGMMYGTKNGNNHVFKAALNQKYNPTSIKRHYAKNMREDVKAGRI